MYQLFMYKSRKPKTQDIFSVDNLKAMCEFESTFTMKQKPDSECEPGIDANGNDVFWNYEDYCLLDSSKNCSLPTMSIVYYFYGDSLTDGVKEWDCSDLDADDVTEKAQVLMVDLSQVETGELEN